MGKISAKANVSNCTGWEDLMRYVSQFLQDCLNQVNGNITFQDNISARVVAATFATTNATVILPHGLGRVPLMWTSGNLTASAVIYQTKAADQNNVYLAASAVCSAKILVI